MNAQELNDENIDQQLDQFWENFELFPSKTERFIFGHIYSLIGVSILPYLVMVAGLLIAHFGYGMDKDWVIRKLTDWQMIIVAVGLVVISPIYLQWQSKIPETFQWLLGAQRISIEGDQLKKTYLEFLLDYQKMLSEKYWRYSFSILFCVFIFIFNWLDPYYLDFIHNGRYMDAMITIIKRLFGLFFWGYLSGLTVWPVFATGSQISKLGKRFNMLVQPHHPDRCGSLKPLGDFCFSMTLPLVVVGIILILLSLGGISILDVNLSGTGEDTILFANVLLFAFFLPLTVITFFLPLWNVHREMVRQKTNYEDEFSNEILRLKDQLRNSIRKECGWEEAKVAKEKIEILQVLNPQSVGYPVWPFRYNLVISLFSPQILGVISTIISVIEIIPLQP
jgi:intracellular septation protein A